MRIVFNSQAKKNPHRLYGNSEENVYYSKAMSDVPFNLLWIEMKSMRKLVIKFN